MLKHQQLNKRYLTININDRNAEEINLMTARHQSEVNELRDHSSSLQNKLHKQQREYERLTQNMKQLAEAQWQTVNGIRPSKQTKQGSLLINMSNKSRLFIDKSV